VFYLIDREVCLPFEQTKREKRGGRHAKGAAIGRSQTTYWGENTRWDANVVRRHAAASRYIGVSDQ
jgi:hypothetical protein